MLIIWTKLWTWLWKRAVMERKVNALSCVQWPRTCSIDTENVYFFSMLRFWRIQSTSCWLYRWALVIVPELSAKGIQSNIDWWCWQLNNAMHFYHDAAWYGMKKVTRGKRLGQRCKPGTYPISTTCCPPVMIHDPQFTTHPPLVSICFPLLTTHYQLFTTLYP